MGFGVSGTFVASQSQVASGVIGMTPISDINLDAGAAATIDFTSVPYYANYFLIFQGMATANKTVAVQFNNDSGANYYDEIMQVVATTITGAQANTATSGRCGRLTNAGVLNTMQMWITNRRADQYKGWTSMFGVHSSNQSSCNGDWLNTAALISRITLILQEGGGNFSQYSDCKLYGVV